MDALGEHVSDAAGLIGLALASIERDETPDVHPGIRAHLRAARTQLDATRALLALDPTPA